MEIAAVFVFFIGLMGPLFRFPGVFRFRRSSVRLLALLLGLLFATLATNYWLVSRANLRNALAHSEANLDLAAKIYDEAVKQQIDSLAHSAGAMSGDYTIRDMLRSDQPDAKTLGSLLQSYTGRVGAPVIAFFDTDGRLLANSNATMENENAGPFRYLIGWRRRPTCRRQAARVARRGSHRGRPSAPAQRRARRRPRSRARILLISLATLNAEFAIEGRPPLSLGILASAATIAGRQRSPAHLSHPFSQAFRPLGSVAVKGRSELVEIFAIDSTTPHHPLPPTSPTSP